MNRPVAHGAIVLAISLAAVGAVATADRGTASASPEAAPQLQSQEVAVAASSSGVPVYDARLQTAGLSDPDPETTGATPVRVQVAEIGLDAPVIPVGVDNKSQLAVPAATTVGWYRYGPHPGEAGASVLAAHVDYGGKPGAFFRLGQLKAGDRLQLAMDNGRTLTFQVTGVFQVEKSQLPADEIFRTDGAPVLQLITCGGSFNPQKHSYDANVVVTAVPVGGPAVPA